MTTSFDRDAIKALALAYGFSERVQLDGTFDLNPYVYDFARACFQAGRYVERLAPLTPPDSAPADQ